MHREGVLDWVRTGAETAEVVLSICAGAFVLARAGLLDGGTVTTHHDGLERLAELAPDAQIERDRRFIDNGAIVTAAGISAGIDAALHVVARLCGAAHAEAAARHMEYASSAWTAKAAEEASVDPSS